LSKSSLDHEGEIPKSILMVGITEIATPDGIVAIRVISITSFGRMRIFAFFQQVIPACLFAMFHPLIGRERAPNPGAGSRCALRSGDFTRVKQISIAETLQWKDGVMHQDQRIGLALGVLLVGACAAFFFRNEIRPSSNAPRLQNARQLDERIAEKSNRPYLNEIEAIESADQSSIQSVGDQRNAESTTGGERPRSMWNSFEGKIIRRKSKAAQAESDVQELDAIPVPSNPDLPEPKHNEESVEKSIVESSSPRTHAVERGETLSSIAAKVFGNPGRYQEIFEANRDQLSDANDVRQGMVLRIPEAASTSSTKRHFGRVHPSRDVDASVTKPTTPTASQSDALSNSAPPSFEGRSVLPKPEMEEQISVPPQLPKFPPAATDNTPTTDPTPARKFVPARILPPGSRPAEPQTRNDRTSNRGRRISQSPLESTSGKVAR
jgi:LysM repeat protein